MLWRWRARGCVGGFRVEGQGEEGCPPFLRHYVIRQFSGDSHGVNPRSRTFVAPCSLAPGKASPFCSHAANIAIRGRPLYKTNLVPTFPRRFRALLGNDSTFESSIQFYSHIIKFPNTFVASAELVRFTEGKRNKKQYHPFKLISHVQP